MVPELIKPESLQIIETYLANGSASTITFDMASQSNSEYLGANLAVLNIGDTIPICVIVPV